MCNSAPRRSPDSLPSPGAAFCDVDRCVVGGALFFSAPSGWGWARLLGMARPGGAFLGGVYARP